MCECACTCVYLQGGCWQDRIIRREQELLTQPRVGMSAVGTYEKEGDAAAHGWGEGEEWRNGTSMSFWKGREIPGQET